MAGTTTTHAIPYPTGGDRINQGDDKIQELAERVDTLLDETRGYAQRSVSGTYSNNTSTNTWRSINFDSLDQADTGYSGNGRGIRVSSAGLYLVSAVVVFNASGNLLLRAYVGPTDTTGAQQGETQGHGLVVNARRFVTTWMVTAAANDTIYVQHFTTNTPTSTIGTNMFRVARLA